MTPDWRHQAACRTVDPELFFPERGKSGNAARAICSHCPVWERCRAEAMETPEIPGVWGGTSECQRRKLRRGKPIVEQVDAAPLRRALRDLAELHADDRNPTGIVPLAKHIAARTGLQARALEGFVHDERRLVIPLPWAAKVCAALDLPGLPRMLWPHMPHETPPQVAPPPPQEPPADFPAYQCGHPSTRSNSYRKGKDIDGRPRWACKICADGSGARRRAKEQAA